MPCRVSDDDTALPMIDALATASRLAYVPAQLAAMMLPARYEAACTTRTLRPQSGSVVTCTDKSNNLALPT